ncbi:MAG: SgcJ/EcaC family oxidoreductase [Pirellulales bacterium]
MLASRTLPGAALGLICASLLSPAIAQDRAAEEQAIRAAAKDYQAALAKGNRETLARSWTDDGTFIDELGHLHPASELIAEAAQAGARPAEPGSVRSTSAIRFLTDDVALEDGVSESVSPGNESDQRTNGHYHATWVKRDGRWRLASLCEVPIAQDASPNLAELGWMVGAWTADQAGVSIEVAIRWNATGTYLLRDLKATHDGQAVFRSTMRIGRDPLSNKLTSWSFDSDGGRGDATWTRQGDSWVGQGTGVLPDGQQTSGTTVITPLGKDSLSWKTLAATIGGAPVPDQEVRFIRQVNSEQ